MDAAGVRLALEFASYGSLKTLEEAIGLCAQVGWRRCGLLLDSWHFFRGGAPWVTLESLEGRQVALVHLNDGPQMIGSDLVHDSRFCRLPPGEGSFDLDRFLDVLSKVGYDGMISLEVLSSRIAGASPAAATAELMAALEKGSFVQEGLRQDPKETSTCV